MKEMIKKFAGKVYDDGTVNGIIAGYDTADNEVLLIDGKDKRVNSYTDIGHGPSVEIYKHWYGYKGIEWVSDFSIENVKLDFSGISTERLQSAVDSYSEGESACLGIYCNSDNCPFDSVYCHAINEASTHYTAFKAELERRENKVNTKMPKLEVGMIVKDRNEDYSILLPDTKEEGKFLFTKSDGNNRYSIIGSKDIVEIRKIKEIYNYYSFFTSGDFINCSETVWKQEPSKKQLLQDKLDKLQEEHNKAVEEIKRELGEIN